MVVMNSHTQTYTHTEFGWILNVPPAWRIASSTLILSSLDKLNSNTLKCVHTCSHTHTRTHTPHSVLFLHLWWRYLFHPWWLLLLQCPTEPFALACMCSSPSVFLILLVFSDFMTGRREPEFQELNRKTQAPKRLHWLSRVGFYYGLWRSRVLCLNMRVSLQDKSG